VIDIAKFEFLRIFYNKKSIAAIIIILFLTLYFVNSGITDYKNFEQNKQDFLRYEKAKVSRYMYYDQYGGYGFRILYEPSPLVIFFEKYKILHTLESNIDTSEIIKPIKSFKGRALFDDGKMKDFGGILFVLGSLYMIIMGFLNFRSTKFIEHIITRKKVLFSILFRVLFLSAAFCFIFFLNYLFAIERGIIFSELDTSNFLRYCMFALCYFLFFYMVGLLLSLFRKTKKTWVAIAVWALFIFVIPEISRTSIYNRTASIEPLEALHLEKITNLMDAQQAINRKVEDLKSQNGSNEEIKALRLKESIQYWTEGYKINKQKEKAFQNQMNAVIDYREKISFIFPTTFYNCLSTELSSEGFLSYIDFLKAIEKIRDNFLAFYVQKRYVEQDKTVDPFFSGEENIIKAQSKLPGNFPPGLLTTIIYLLALLLISVYRIKKTLNYIPLEERSPKLEYKKGTSFFVLCRDEEYRNNVFKILTRQGNNISGLDSMSEIDLGFEMAPQKVIDIFPNILEVEKNKVLDNLKALDVKEMDLKEPNPSIELLKKLYSSLTFAKGETFIINDYLKGESRPFEKHFLNLIDQLINQGKTVVYLGTEIYNISVSHYKTSDYLIFEGIDTEKTSFR